MKHGYNPLRSIGAWRSPASALAWGARGRRFESSRPDSNKRNRPVDWTVFSYVILSGAKNLLTVGETLRFAQGDTLRLIFMESNEETIYPPTNKQSIFSLVFGILTIVFFCMGWLPFPLTGTICFPVSVLFGILALLFGVISLHQIRRHNHSGRPMAWLGIVIGGFVFVCVLCVVILIASIFVFSPDSFHVPPFLDKYQI